MKKALTPSPADPSTGGTLYDTLGVPPGAPREQLRRAWLALAQKYHPDRNPDDTVASDIMAEINVAYGVLSDPTTRKRYDAVNHIAQLCCKRCGGAGSTMVTRNFGRAVPRPCKACGGSGRCS